MEDYEEDGHCLGGKDTPEHVLGPGVKRRGFPPSSSSVSSNKRAAQAKDMKEEMQEEQVIYHIYMNMHLVLQSRM